MERKPTNILEAIFWGMERTNENVVTLSENLKDMFDQVVAMKDRVDEMLKFFNQPAPEEPTALGEDGAVTESREQAKTDEV